MRKMLLIASAAVAFAALPGTAIAMDKVPGGPGGSSGGGGGHSHGPGCGHGGSSGGGSSGGPPTSVPEPGSIVLLGGGIAALGIARRIRRRR